MHNFKFFRLFSNSKIRAIETLNSPSFKHLDALFTSTTRIESNASRSACAYSFDIPIIALVSPFKFF